MTEVLVAEDLRRTYGDAVALDGVSLSVAEGEVFGCIGPNGAGKTTLVRALTGTTAASGEARLFGHPPSRVDADRVGLLPQSFSPAERLTARELVAYYGGLYDQARDPDAVLRDVGLADDADVRYEALSGGQRRRACVAAALVNDPDLLFLDEPTTGIDPAGRRSLHALVEGLADGGTTVFLTSHSMSEVERLADRVGLLRDGRFVAVGPPDELVAEHGGESRLVVETDATVESVEGYRVERTDRGLVVHGVGPTAIGDVAAALADRGVTYDSLAWHEPGLEEVYLRLTGESFEGESGRSASLDPTAAEVDAR
ncbi:MAG: ABC transporter ATP-binding protein [Haloferacaceae archaeon]